MVNFFTFSIGKSFDSLDDINKNQDIPISDINIINNEKDNKILGYFTKFFSSI